MKANARQPVFWAIWGLLAALAPQFGPAMGLLMLAIPAAARAGEGASVDRGQALAALRSFHLGTTLTPQRRNELEELKAPEHEKDSQLISAYRFEALGAAYWLFCAPREESRQATELQVYLASTTTLQGRDAGVLPPATAVDGLRGARVVFRRFVRCEGEDKPYYMTAFGVIPYTVVPGRGAGTSRVPARLVPIPPPDNLRIRCEIDEGVFIGLPFDLDCDGCKLAPHVHFNPQNKPCLYGEHGQTLACGLAQHKPAGGVARAEALVASVHMCSSCHMEGNASMVDGKLFLLPRERMEGFLQFPKLAQADLRASEIDLAEIRAQLRNPANSFVPPELPKAIEEAWLACYPDYLKCKAAQASASPSK
jgi:hypothetical protein